MVPIKRKASTKNEPIPPKKKQKPEVPFSNLSILKEEEPAFPRGGASILSPLEYKQIKIQATNDVLFEQSTDKKPVRNDFGYDENDEGQSGRNERQPSSKTMKKKPSKNTIGQLITTDQGTGVRIEGLNYKVST